MPREKMVAKGADALTDIELLALLLRIEYFNKISNFFKRRLYMRFSVGYDLDSFFSGLAIGTGSYA